MIRSLVNPLGQFRPAAARNLGRRAILGRANFASFILVTLVFSSLALVARAELSPEWVTRFPVGTSLTSGIAGIYVDPDGVSYITGISGPSSNTDVTTVSIAADGSTRWSQTYNSGGSNSDQARGITKSADGIVYVVGNTPGPGSFANVLILGYDADTGALLKTIKYRSGTGISEFGSSIVTDSAGNIYVIGGTNGDGPDVMTLKFNSAGTLQWRKVFDGPGFPPLDQDSPVKILLDPAGNVLSCITAYTASGHPDYEVVKYAATNGATLWETSWGVTGGDFPGDMEIDAAGDVYVSGIGIDFIDKYSTVKFRGSDGGLIWQFYDAEGLDHSFSGLFLDGAGGVYITGQSDPDGDLSNFNDNFFTVKRDAATGAQLWTHTYGQNCVGCWDIPSDVRVDSDGNVFVAGITSSPPFSNDIILFVLDSATGLEINRGLVFNTGSEILHTGALRFDAAFNLFDGGYIYNADTGAVDMTVTKWASLVEGGSIPCDDLVSFQTRCVRNDAGRHRVQARLTLTDTSHSGGQVTIAIDGKPFTVPINGNRAELSLNAQVGSHNFALIDPPSCFPPSDRDCD